MSILEKLERKMPWLNFPKLNLYMVIIMLLGIAMNTLNPYFYLHYLCLNVAEIMRGQVWRLVTFIFFPPTLGFGGFGVLLSLLMVYVYYSMTKTLIMIWGYFKFNLYLFIGYISQIVGAFIIYFILKENVIVTPSYTIFSLIMAFALSFPEAVFLIYFFIPIKAKYFAYFEIVIYVMSFLGSNLADRVSILCSAMNVFVFFVLLKNKV